MALHTQPKRTDCQRQENIQFGYKCCSPRAEASSVGSCSTRGFHHQCPQQLARYVETRRLMETAGRKARPVAGLVAIMYNDGAL
mmetsp:Transcript_9085/g.22280  ORF Transcript_9085/g.22280 Transcript_9085/m.22280 type:complete len:84 (+) Transcript_9085:523-774(+)